MTSVSRRTISTPSDARGHRAAPRRAVHADVPARAMPGRASSFRRTDRPGHADDSARSSSTRCCTERRTQLGDGRPTRCTPWSTCWPRSRRWASTTSRSSWTVPSRRSWTAARRRSSTRCQRPGLRQSAAQPEYLDVSTEPVRVIDGESVYEAYPSTRLELDVTIEFPHPLIGRQDAAVRVTPDAFASELAPAGRSASCTRSSACARGADQGRVDRERGRARRQRRVERTRCAGPTSSCGTRRWTAWAISRWRARACGRASWRTNRVTRDGDAGSRELS